MRMSDWISDVCSSDLFALPRSSRAEYDKKLFSKGGGVFSRQDKTIKLSPQAREMLDIEATELEPTALISAILKAPVDLIWFGGIGTYLKAAAEPHIDVGDPGNDQIGRAACRERMWT